MLANPVRCQNFFLASMADDTTVVPERSTLHDMPESEDSDNNHEPLMEMKRIIVVI